MGLQGALEHVRSCYGSAPARPEPPELPAARRAADAAYRASLLAAYAYRALDQGAIDWPQMRRLQELRTDYLGLQEVLRRLGEAPCEAQPAAAAATHSPRQSGRLASKSSTALLSLAMALPSSLPAPAGKLSATSCA